MEITLHERYQPPFFFRADSFVSLVCVYMRVTL